MADGGASHFARTVQLVKKAKPSMLVECLVSDFQGAEEVMVLAQGPFQCGQRMHVPKRVCECEAVHAALRRLDSLHVSISFRLVQTPTVG